MGKRFLVGLVLGLSSMSAMAQVNEVREGWFLNPQISTLGAGVNVGKYITQDFALRANVNGGIDYSRKFKNNSVNYDATLKLFTAGLLADYHPFNNGFKITAGAYYNDNHINATGNFGSIRINGVRYNADSLGNGKARADFKKFAPYLGLGYHSVKPKGWSVTGDVGVMFQDSARVSYDLNCITPICDAARPIIEPQIEEERRSLEKRASKYKFFPVVSLGVAYRF